MHSFETVWQTVNQVHYDPTFGGVDWKAAHEQYKPQIVAAAENKKESFLLINQMLFELNLSHLLAVYPDDLKRYIPVLFAEGGIGVDVRLLDGEAVIPRVRTGTPAAQAGLHPGLIIERIDGKPVEQIIQEGEALLIPPFNPRNRLNNLSGYISGHIYGPPKTEVKIHFRDKDGKRKETVIRRISRGRGIVAMDAMPPFYVEFEAKRLGNNIGYVWFNHWAKPVDGKFIAALSSMRDIRGLIIDLRDNPGGFGVLCIPSPNICWQKKPRFLHGNPGTKGLNTVLIRPRVPTLGQLWF
jgi:C-terminal processing protease CtpA/Prc